MEKSVNPIQTQKTKKRTFKEREEEEKQEYNLHARELIGSFWSKDDLYEWFTVHEQYVLPPKRECWICKPAPYLTCSYFFLGFLKQILAGEKTPPKLDELRMVKVPQYKEVSGSSLTLALCEEFIPSSKKQFLITPVQEPSSLHQRRPRLRRRRAPQQRLLHEGKPLSSHHLADCMHCTAWVHEGNCKGSSPQQKLSQRRSGPGGNNFGQSGDDGQAVPEDNALQ